MRYFLVLICALLSGGCSHQYSDFFPYHDDGTLKPHVALLPVVDTSDSGLPWDVSRELTNKIRYKLMCDGSLYIPSEKVISKQLKAVANDDLTTTVDLKPFLQFHPSHFVIVMDLIEHRVVPYQRGKIKPLYVADIPTDDAVVLLMKLKLRVVDIRGATPRIVRQEVIESNHMMEKNAVELSIGKIGTPTFGITPLAIAHARIAKDVASKIEQMACFKK